MNTISRVRPAHQTYSRLTPSQTKFMDDYEAYDEVETVDLDKMPEMPIGDETNEEYEKISRKPGQLGGKKKRKSRSLKRKSQSLKRKSRSLKRKSRSLKRKSIKKKTRKNRTRSNRK
jgi:hypothetical protein